MITNVQPDVEGFRLIFKMYNLGVSPCFGLFYKKWFDSKPLSTENESESPATAVIKHDYDL
ncbi:hypothetical protein GCM10010912_37590 [Paenibacillus albidus]|uniref:Uncharacterized protein n=1 Tax=Paenibacillus albidus TaxID=2041023 RepID=A0A917FJH0_9BACL|nr:hypothetical protein GCM10010912_37590 [Paenibacillus albidus]